MGIPRNKLLEFQGSPDPLAAVIDYWLRGNVTEPISWDTIVTALRSHYVSEAGLAEEINQKYCQQKGTKLFFLMAAVLDNDLQHLLRKIISKKTWKVSVYTA